MMQVSDRVLASPGLIPALAGFGKGEDATISVPLSVRPLLIASVFLRQPRPTLVLVSGEETVIRFGNALSALLGRERIREFPCREDLPFGDRAPDPAVIGQRMEALDALARGLPLVVVASARSLLRCLPPKGSLVTSPLRFATGEEMGVVALSGELEALSYDDLPAALVARGYQRQDQADEPGTFSLHGDTLDVFGAGAINPVRVELFDTEVEAIRGLVAGTGQSISDLDQATVYPCREFMLSKRGVQRAVDALAEDARKDTQLSEHLEALEEMRLFQGVDRYLPYLFAHTDGPMAHVGAGTLLVVVEPRSLFDDASRAYDELKALAESHGATLEGLYLGPGDLDFGEHQRLTLLSIMKTGSFAQAEMEMKRVDALRTEEQVQASCNRLIRRGNMVLFSLPDRRVRESMKLLLTDASIPIIDHSQNTAEALRQGVVNIVDMDLPSSYELPDAKLAVMTLNDSSRSRNTASRSRKRVDPTSLTFPFAPGDYVVHSTYGIALFKEIIRRETDGQERDYLLLEYAKGDKLYVPIERIDKVTRYVGPDGSAPRLTRLNMADWSRAISKARKSAHKMAFDLVDLYSRRSAVKGFAYSPDSPWQREMEDTFPYEETPDQLAAVADVKADMESDKPMDRLVCGDVGFGKTEVAIRAAFKAIQDNRQVMLLCPTTILAQQHFITFSERFAPFGVQVEVLSRFRTPAQQKKALAGFAKGTVDMLVGTHRLLSRDVNPRDLGLIIIDEEQRFGVQHKEQLKNLREQVDVLTLTATPIPRTLQMSLSGVRDMSIIETPPASRSAVRVHVGEWDEDVVSAAIRNELERDGQVYYVSNRVRNIQDAVDRVHQAVPEARVVVAHGQMSERELENAMEIFSAGEADVLVSTTIIESGLDNPHSNTLIIEDSQRLGLAQLYQLKGRVGRSHAQAYAFFLFPADSSLTDEAQERLTAIHEFQDLGSGMKVAMRDLEIRGAGTLLGAEQSGNLSAVGFDLFASMLAQAVAEARQEEVPAEDLDVKVDIPGDTYLPEDYIPAVDQRVLFYRRIALARSLEDVERVKGQLRDAFGEIPDPARNMLERSQAQIMAAALGITSISLVKDKLVLEDVDLVEDQKEKLQMRGGIYYVKSSRLSYPVRKDEAAMDVLLTLLEDLAVTDETDDTDEE